MRLLRGMLGVIGVLAGSLSAYTTYAHPKMESVWDASAWALLGVYIALVNFQDQ